MKEKTSPGIFGSANTGPLVLLFSPRERVRDILTVGLIQCGYQVIQSTTSYVATIKTTQLMPSIVVADLSCDNPRDILLAARIQRSARTRHIAILLILTHEPHPFILQLLAELADRTLTESSPHILSIGYPFTFADFLEKIKQITPKETSPAPSHPREPLPDVNRGVALNLFDLSIPVSKKFTEIQSVMQRQWAFPFTVVRAFDIIESEASCCSELAKCISTDLSVSSAVLRVSNTVYYARRFGRISDVKDAVARLGFRETRNILACLTLIDLTPDIYKNRGFERREFWLHSLTVALIAEKLCMDCGFARPEYGFVAGLLHDLGKIPLDNNFDNVFPRLLDETISSLGAFWETEKRLMGFSHAELGHYLSTQWNFPASISSAILNHHDRDRILHAPSMLEKIVQEAVFVGNLLAKAVSIGHSCDEILEEVPPEMVRDLKLGLGPGERFFASIYNQATMLCQFLNLTLEDMPIARPLAGSSDYLVTVVLEERSIFHPLIVALRNNGFVVKLTTKYPTEEVPGKNVIIAIPEKELPSDIMVCDVEDGDPEKVNCLKIFLVALDYTKSIKSETHPGDIIFMNRNNFDMRILIHTLDTFFGRVITPPVDEGEPKEQKSEKL